MLIRIIVQHKGFYAKQRSFVGMQNKEIQHLIGECFKAIELRVESVVFSLEWKQPRNSKNEVIVTLADHSESYGGDKCGFAVESPARVYWICLFRDELIKHLFDNPNYKDRAKEGLMLVCIHETLHILDLRKNGKNTYSEDEINKLAGHYTRNPILKLII